MEVGDRVEKVNGYRFPGIVVSKFNKLDGKTERFVVECTAPLVCGMLHIFNGNQLQEACGEREENKDQLRLWPQEFNRLRGEKPDTSPSGFDPPLDLPPAPPTGYNA